MTLRHKKIVFFSFKKSRILIDKIFIFNMLMKNIPKLLLFFHRIHQKYIRKMEENIDFWIVCHLF